MSDDAGRAALLAALCIAPSAQAVAGDLAIPATAMAPTHSMTIDDAMARRHIDTLSVSPDGARFAIFVRQADPKNNEYRTDWLVGDIRGSGLISLGAGGEVGPKVMYTGHMPGVIGGHESQWSPDGSWIAYTLRRGGEVQLWRSRVDGSVQEQLTHNAADVREFAWSDDGRALYFSAGTSRAELHAREQARSHEGYRYDEDLWMFTDLLGPQLIRAPQTDLSVWVVTAETREERRGGEADQAAFRSIQARNAEQIDRPKQAFACRADECTGAINQVWSGGEGKKLFFWRGEGINNTENAFYSWNPATGNVTALLRLRDDELRLCRAVVADLVCVRENASAPDQVVALDLQSGRVRVLADVNPEMRSIRLGKVERFEWATPELAWNEPGGELAGLYPKRAYGYILYPPDFDATKKYPVFIDPYVASGFDPLGAEHPLHVYAANGIVVLRTGFPSYIDRSKREQAGMKQLYSAELGFPHLTMLMESTLRGLDAAIARGFVDERRVGIGGVSHGTFVPLYLMQKHDRIAAISISSPSWGPMQYYWGTRKARDAVRALGPNDNWARSPEGDGREFWRQIDIADHVDAIEAPILMHLAAHETYGLVRFIRNLSDAGKPYDAYVFSGETHIKWQPAHLQAIAARNLDWFRFWLQGFEDTDPAKVDQYRKWRELRPAN